MNKPHELPVGPTYDLDLGSDTRSEATKRGTSVTLAPGTGGWTNGWTIADPAIGGRDVLSHGPLTGLAMTGPDSVVYKLSGRVQGTAPSFTLSMSAGGTTAKRCVQTDLSGRPYVKTC